ncbi:hypothetical protein PPERSA_11629 [Pseudocohnilembus persalinus]|uniref:Uncharacterized protein n=1 Tax=Pseudocohnilembus persalinus TaxID=266149 RepID=A0A0V0QAD5_PSEPJ|nr:hypothetical protein PPERSA_11629 [Pseudocohnilembus persalinus]|eukprot:KRW99028.1 hypothetical protein PPERSA_11629 [Pseudocohnilembus persalinus]
MDTYHTNNKETGPQITQPLLATPIIIHNPNYNTPNTSNKAKTNPDLNDPTANSTPRSTNNNNMPAYSQNKYPINNNNNQGNSGARYQDQHPYNGNQQQQHHIILTSTRHLIISIKIKKKFTTNIYTVVKQFYERFRRVKQ